MLKKVLTTVFLTLASPAFADDSPANFLDELEALVKLQATTVLKQSISGYYSKNVDIDQGKYPSLLHDAAIMGSLKLLQYLIKHDPHGVDYAYENGPTPLGYIAGDNQIAAAKLLLQAGANPNNVGNTDNVFPLYSAVTSGNMKMVQLLLKYDAETHIGTYYQSPLGLTLEKNDIETLQLFDMYGFKLNSMDDELRIIVTEYLNSDFVEEEVLRILQNHGFDIYAKTPEKGSYIELYGDKIEHIDVKQMLQDLYEVREDESPVLSSKEQSTVENMTKLSSDIKDVTATSVGEEPSLEINTKVTAPEVKTLSDPEVSADSTVIEIIPVPTEALLVEQIKSNNEVQAKALEMPRHLDNSDNIVKNDETASNDVATVENSSAALLDSQLDNKSTDTGVSPLNSVIENNQNINNTEN